MSEPTYDREQSRRLTAEANGALRRGDVAGALQALSKASKADPHDDELLLLAATLQIRNGEPVRAAHLAVDALEVRPFHPSALDVLGVACIEALQPDLARKILERAIGMAPGMENPTRNMGDAKRRARELRDEAVPKKEILLAANLLPQARIRRLLESRDPELTVAIVVQDESDAVLADCLASLEPLRPLTARTLVLDARPDGASPLSLDAGGPAEAEIVRVSGSAPAAHNEALRWARTDWVLVLEAGERLGEGASPAIEQAMRDERTLGHAVTLEHGTGAPRRALRLVRNAPELRFSGRWNPRLHPSVAPLCGKWGLELGVEPVAVLRSEAGDAPLDDARRSKLIALLKRDVETDPTDHAARLDLAWLNIENGGAADALHGVRQVRNALAADPRRRAALEMEEPTVLEAWCLARQDKNHEMGKLIAEYHAAYEPTPNTLFLAGVAARSGGDLRDGAELFQRSLAMDCEPGWAKALPEVAGPVLPNMLGLAWIDGGEFERARSAFDTALRRDPDNMEAELGQLAATFGEGEMEKVLHELDRLVETHGEDPKVWISGGIVLGQVPQLTPAAVEWLEEACRRIPGHPELLRRLGEAQLRCGRAEAALETWKELDPDDTKLIPARVAACLACGGTLPELSERKRTNVEQGVLVWFQRWAASASWDALDRALVDLPRADDALPGLIESTAAWLERGGQLEAAQNLRARRGVEVE